MNHTTKRRPIVQAFYADYFYGCGWARPTCQKPSAWFKYKLEFAAVKNE